MVCVGGFILEVTCLISGHLKLIFFVYMNFTFQYESGYEKEVGEEGHETVEY